MKELVRLLTTESLRDYVIALPNRERWLYLGRAYAPRQLLASYGRTPCDLYAVSSAEKCDIADVVPAWVEELNGQFFCTDCVGLTDRQAVWEIATMKGLPYPTLWRIGHQDFRRFFVDHRKTWWNHAARRRYERIVIVPREAA